MTRKPQAYALIFGQAISTFGDYIARTALTLFILDKTGSAFDVGVMLIMNSLPAIIGISSAYLTKKYRLKDLLVYYSLISAVLSMLMIFFTGYSFSLIGIYLVYFALSLSNSFYVPTRLTLLIDIVDEKDLRKFNSLDQTLEAVMMSAGIVAAGYLYALIGIGNVFLINSISFLIIAFTILFVVKIQANKNEEALNSSNSAKKKKISETYKEVIKQKDLRFLTVGVGISGLAVGIFSTMFIIFVRKELNASAVVFSQFASVRALVSSIVGFCFSMIFVKVSEKKMVVMGYVLMGVSIIFMTIWSSYYAIMIFNIIIGATNMLYYISVRTLLQKTGELPKTELFALQSAILRLTMVLASGLSGIFADTINFDATLQLRLSGILFIGVGLWAYKALTSSKRDLVS